MIVGVRSFVFVVICLDSGWAHKAAGDQTKDAFLHTQADGGCKTVAMRNRMRTEGCDQTISAARASGGHRAVDMNLRADDGEGQTFVTVDAHGKLTEILDETQDDPLIRRVNEKDEVQQELKHNAFDTGNDVHIRLGHEEQMSGVKVEQKEFSDSTTASNVAVNFMQVGSRANEALRTWTVKHLRSLVNTQARVIFMHDSQATEARLHHVVEHQLTDAGFDVTLAGHSGACLTKPHSLEFPGCFKGSALDEMKSLCQQAKVDIVISWVGLNDLKKDNNNLMQSLGQDLSSYVDSISRACGNPKVVLVHWPIFTYKPENPKEVSWPNNAIPEMVQIVEHAFAGLAPSPDLHIVDGQALADANDFDRVGHFCTDGRTCNTSTTMSAAIVDAVKQVSRPVFPGLRVPPSSHESSNASTWLSILAVTSVPLLGLEGAAYTLRTTVTSHALVAGRQAWLPLFDVARLLGALHIVVFHLYQSTAEAFAFGKYWLSFFFFTSGFAHGYVVNTRGAIANVKHGLKKVYFGYALAVAIFLFAQWGEVIMVPVYDVLTTLTLTQSLLPPFHSYLNGPAWFLSTLMAFWFLSPHWSCFLHKLTQWQSLLLLAFCWLATLVPAFACFVVLKLNLDVGGDVPQLVEFHFSQRWPVYMGGMTFAYVTRNISEFSLRSIIGCLVILVGGIGVISQLSPAGFMMGRNYLLVDHGFVTFPLFCAFAWLALAFPSKKLSSVTKWVGLLAQPVFILHIPIMALVQLLHGGSTMFWKMLFFSACGVIAVDECMQKGFRRKAAEDVKALTPASAPIGPVKIPDAVTA